MVSRKAKQIILRQSVYVLADYHQSLIGIVLVK